MRFICNLFILFCVLFCPTISQAQIILTKVSDMEFGVLEYDASYNGEVQLGTDGNLAVTGTGLAISGTGQPGQVSWTATPSDVVEVKCRRSVRMFSPTGERLTVNLTEASIDTGVPFGSGVPCDNLGGARTPVAVIDMAVNPNPTVFIGGRIRINAGAGLVSGTYSSTNTGGRAMRVRVIFQ